ncbi:MAG TPA: redox-regulated ATPase YchF, partial [Planctomycetes bacterium]|nr:redox-regulated ATPase YchF [Planctomycetota bacterium]
GKSSLFRLLTGGQSEGRPGRAGRVSQRQAIVADPRVDRLVADYKPRKTTLATIDFLDFPPLGNRSEGQKRSFAELLTPARDSQALVVMVRNFENAALPPAGGAIDPAAELAEVIDELRLADLEVATNRREKIIAQIPKKRGQDRKALETEQPLIEQVVIALEEGRDVSDLKFQADEEKILRGYQFLSAKPRLVVENLSEGRECTIPVSIGGMVAIESDLAELEEEDRATFAEEFGLEGSCVDAVIGGIYERSGLVSFLTAGDPEVRAWPVPRGTVAVTAAGEVHSDIERGFIRAEVVSYDDYVTDGGIPGAREKGHFRLEGKEYVVADGDIINFLFKV